MQSSDNFDHAVTSQFLADCGFSTSGSFKSCARFPSIAYRHRTRSFTLYFQGPDRCGIQHFDFFEPDFLAAFENSKFLRLVSSSFDDESRLPFDKSEFFPDSALAVYPKLVFKFFSVTPTVLNLAKRLVKKHKRKIILKPKLASVYKALGIYSYPSAPHSRSPRGSLIYQPSPNMLAIIQNAATQHDLNWFSLYFDEFLCLTGKKAVTRRIRDEVEKDFRKRVNEAQRA